MAVARPPRSDVEVFGNGNNEAEVFKLADEFVGAATGALDVAMSALGVSCEPQALNSAATQKIASAAHGGDGRKSKEGRPRQRACLFMCVSVLFG
jgi:hypothetical protein